MARETPLEGLVALVARLRSPEGCPWDRKQTLHDIKRYLLDEAYEVAQAIDSGDRDNLREELGDLLFQIVFMARLAEEDGAFDLGDVIETVKEKMIRRHPHVFGDVNLSSPQEVVKQWEEIKEREGKTRGSSILSGVSEDLPALYRAYRLGLKAAKVGFDWKGPQEVMEKVREELAELEEALEAGLLHEASEELGDLLFVLANLARHLGRDPEGVLRKANEKFIGRFQEVERALAEKGRTLDEASPEEMESLWESLKGRSSRPAQN